MFRRGRAQGLGVVVGAVVVMTSAAAYAQEECPIGSVQKMESGKTWCEPTVCDADINCTTGSVCRMVPLCVEIGVLDAKDASAEAGTKLLVRQRCGANKACPQNTTCSEKSRCVTLAQADKAGLTTASAASAAAPAASGATGGDAPKKSCGCHMPGNRGGELGGAALALLGAVVISARRRARRA